MISDEQHQREIWQSRCPELLAERDRAEKIVAEVLDRETDLLRVLKEAEEERDRLREAAQAFIDTMGLHWSDAAGREVPRGFTADSSEAAVALFDALAATTESGECVCGEINTRHCPVHAEAGDEACTRCGATPETGQRDECPECQGIVPPRVSRDGER